ncbi:MAG TPA: GTPase ObgE [Bacteroidales bacterium]|jgi:GTP-binding protein|nr:GTPase ObgE [Bacteroidales bacterium]
MSENNFIDFIKIYLKSGNGGAGSVHFHRDKRTIKGGPDGGDGGRGGHIILKGNRNLWTLLHLRYHKHFIAGNGGHGSSNNRFGADADDIYIEVPLGTQVKDAETNELLAEVTEHNQEIILLKGGRGGKGNSFFKSATMRTPRFAQQGEEGQERWVYIELKILADVGLVGFPNAGKSTLLSSVSAAKPKIADYPFTTLVPNVGIVKVNDRYSFVMADIPGIIEGAHEGKGLGLRFLRHIERNSILLFLIPANSPDILAEYTTLIRELELYNEELLSKKRIVAISKADLLSIEDEKKILRKISKLSEPKILFSSVSQKKLPELVNLIWEKLNED